MRLREVLVGVLMLVGAGALGLVAVIGFLVLVDLVFGECFAVSC